MCGSSFFKTGLVQCVKITYLCSMNVDEIYAEMVARIKTRAAWATIKCSDSAIGKSLRLSSKLTNSPSKYPKLRLNIDRVDSDFHKEGFYWAVSLCLQHKKKKPCMYFGHVTSLRDADALACYEGMMDQFVAVSISLDVVKQYNEKQKVAPEYYRKEKIKKL